MIPEVSGISKVFSRAVWEGRNETWGKLLLLVKDHYCSCVRHGVTCEGGGPFEQARDAEAHGWVDDFHQSPLRGNQDLL